MLGWRLLVGVQSIHSTSGHIFPLLIYIQWIPSPFSSRILWKIIRRSQHGLGAMFWMGLVGKSKVGMKAIVVHGG